MKTDALIGQLSKLHPKGYDLSLGRIGGLLDKLANPQKEIPPAFHVAGTNGKGSVIANLRAILEAGGHTTHAHTSPHLVNYHERYRVGHRDEKGNSSGKVVSDDMLAEVLGRVAEANGGARITVFELLSAAMFVLFSEQTADYSIVEVGLGGRFDGTNVIDKPLVSIIMTVSLDHEMHLGKTVEKIAFEKGGIIKPGYPVVIGPQVDEAREVLEEIARQAHCPMMIAGQDFDYHEEAGRFVYQDNNGLLDLPMPKLLGEHQLANSATAIAATRIARCDVSEPAYEMAMSSIYWPGRFEQLAAGKITKLFDAEQEIWIDGGHNAGAGEAIAKELGKLNAKTSKQLVMICAMLNSKDPEGYFSHFCQHSPKLYTIPVAGSDYGIEPGALAGCARNAGLDAVACTSLEAAIEQLSAENAGGRVLISGTLYLVGEVLKKNGTPPK